MHLQIRLHVLVSVSEMMVMVQKFQRSRNVLVTWSESQVKTFSNSLKIRIITYQLKIFVYAFSFSHVGASPECCQGSRPTATADAYCGWILNIDNAQDAKSSIPLCGELGLKKLGYWFLLPEINHLFFKPEEIIFISDCIAPFSIDIEFDEWSDMGAKDPTAPTMDPNDLTSCGKFLL